MAVSNEEAVIKELWLIQNSSNLIITSQFNRVYCSLYDSGIRAIVEAFLCTDHSFQIFSHCAHIFRTWTKPNAYCIGYLLKSPFLAFIRVYPH